MSDYTVDVFMYEEMICRIHVSRQSVTFENYISDIVWLPFGVKKAVTYSDLLEFYEDRCFPRERENCKEVLKSIGLDYYDPEEICRKTHGVQFDDFIWLQFSDEPQVNFEDIRIR